MVGHNRQFIHTHLPGHIKPRSGARGDQQTVKTGDFVVEELPHMPNHTGSPGNGHGVWTRNMDARIIAAWQEPRERPQGEGRGVRRGRELGHRCERPDETDVRRLPGDQCVVRNPDAPAWRGERSVPQPPSAHTGVDRFLKGERGARQQRRQGLRGPHRPIVANPGTPYLVIHRQLPRQPN